MTRDTLLIFNMINLMLFAYGWCVDCSFFPFCGIGLLMVYIVNLATNVYFKAESHGRV